MRTKGLKMSHANNHPNINKQFGLFFQKARLNAGFTQCHISSELGFKNGQYVSNFERGLCWPRFNDFEFLLEKYRIGKKDFIEYFIKLEKHNLELRFGLVEKPEIIKTPFLSISLDLKKNFNQN